jgi:hypothetical protein
VAGLLEMAAVTEARAWLAFFEEHAADLFPRLGEGWLALLRLGVLALEGELHEASELLGRTPLEIGSRRVNHARLLLAEAALAEGRPEMARAVLAPLDRQDAFGRERIAWLHLRLGEWDAAEVYILPMVQKEAHRSGRSLANVLYGALLLARGKDKAAAEVFALLPDRDFPRTWTLGAYDESGRLGGGDVVPSWLFPWERRDLERHRALLRHVRGDHERARRHRAEAEAVMRRSVSRDRDLPGPPQSPLIRF